MNASGENFLPKIQGDMLKLGSVASMGLPKYLLILRSRNTEDYGCEQHAEENREGSH